MWSKFLSKLADLSVKRPVLVILCFLLLIALSIYSAQNIRYEFAHSTYFSEDDPYYQQYILYQKDFEVGVENAFIFVKADDVYSKECLEYMDELSKSLKEIECVSTVVSPSNIVKKKLKDTFLKMKQKTKKL